MESVGRDLTATCQHPQRDGQVKRCRLLGQVGRSKIDDGAMDRIEVAGVLDGSFDAVSAFLDGGFGQTDENDLGHSNVRAIDFDLDGHRVDSQQRKGFEFDKHTGLLSRKAGKVSHPPLMLTLDILSHLIYDSGRSMSQFEETA